MKKFILFILPIIAILTCTRDWNNILDTDDDLSHTPEIVKIELNANNDIEISLNYSYSDSSSVVLERRTQTAFENVLYQRLTQSTLLDTSFDKEANYSFVYRVRVEKGEYRTAYSKEKAYQYVSTALNAPTNFQVITVELQGVHLIWNDKSNNETNYKIERNGGTGFVEIAGLSANSESYFDSIAGISQAATEVFYRVQAYSLDVTSP